MPELPEVETIVRELCKADLVDCGVVDAQIFWPRTVSTPPHFVEKIKDQTLKSIARRGKYLVLTLSRDTLLIHLRMTGKFVLDADPSPLQHERVQLTFSDKRVLHYVDQRKFGRWHLVENSDEVLSQIGLEPLSEAFTFAAFQTVLRGRTTRIKPFLLDQQHVAGLGNIYVDEALWEAKIHPERSVDTLTTKEMRALHRAIPLVLTKGIANKGTSLGSHLANYFSVSGHRGGNQFKLNVFRREGLPCFRCDQLIVKTVVAQRGTHWCPTCQKQRG